MKKEKIQPAENRVNENDSEVDTLQANLRELGFGLLALIMLLFAIKLLDSNNIVVNLFCIPCIWIMIVASKQVK